MNSVTKNILDQFQKMAELADSATAILDKQISWLSGLRDAVQQSRTIATDAITKIESGEVKIDDPAETATQFKTLVDANDQAAETVETIPARPANQQRYESQWEIMARLMAGKPSFTMTEVGKALEVDLGRSLGPNRPQMVRNNLLRHPETFRQNADKSWAVIRVPGEIPEELTEVER